MTRYRCSKCAREINPHLESYYSDTDNRTQWCVACARLASEHDKEARQARKQARS